MPIETIYQPPDGEGPSVAVTLFCDGCKHLKFPELNSDAAYCGITDIWSAYIGTVHITPSWCPIVASDPDTWQRRIRGEA